MKLHVLTFASPDRLGKVVQTDLQLLTEAAEKRGHTLETIFARDCKMRLGKRQAILIANKKASISMLINKANFIEDIHLHAELIKQFELAGIPMVNDYASIYAAKNKIRNLQILSEHGVPIPRTYIVRSSEYVKEISDAIGHYPVILKTITGSHGFGVSIIESQRGLRSVIDMLIEREYSAPLIVQEFVRESSGKDVRVFIVGTKVVAAMERIAKKKGEFRSNFQLGGRVKIADLSKKEIDIALEATKACGLEMAGVDVIRTKEGPKILEVNSNPGLEGITQATGKDIAGEIIEYAVKKAQKIQSKRKV